ncbi:MAG: Fic family protein [Lutibacter sp.]|uniref:Fic family protein n=1 Tax=Lutibacter sp. TaxID=1925666 RepID=UPI0038585BBD
MELCIHQKKEWPKFKWDTNSIVTLLAKVRNLQGKITGKMESIGFDLQSEAVLETITIDVIKSTEIEGEILNLEQVRSSVARRLGFYIENEIPSERNVDGVVDMLVDATQNFNLNLTKERLFDWHAALFPTGRSGMYKIIVGDWRKDTTGPMQVVSGVMGKEKVHFEAPKSDLIDAEMKQFLNWYNKKQTLDPVLKAAISHLWFITIHPFEDGNGRIARALTDQLLARADGMPQRYYSMSSQIRVERKQYYNTLEKTQQGGLEITDWLVWFLQCLLNALESSNVILEKVLHKHKFWNTHGVAIQNERQKVMLNKLLDNFNGKLTSSKWAKITKCSNDTALRDIQDLIKKGILKREIAGGRSTNYDLVTLMTSKI